MKIEFKVVEETVDGLKTTVAELAELVEILTEETARLKRSNKICRIVIKSLRQQLNIAYMNDELMKALCAPDLIINDVDDQGGLPEVAPSQDTGVQL